MIIAVFQVQYLDMSYGIFQSNHQIQTSLQTSAISACNWEANLETNLPHGVGVGLIDGLI